MAYKKKTNNPRMGRPKKHIDKGSFEKLCGLQCTEEEIMGFFDVCSQTLESWCKNTYEGQTFSQVFRRFRGNGKISLRRAQFDLAQKNASMAIFLGKNWLGQTESPQPAAVNNEEEDALSKALRELGENL